MRLAGLLALLAFALPAAADDAAAAWIVQRDDRILRGHAVDSPRPVASLVKLLHALVWIQQPARLEDVVTVSSRAAAATGARAGLGAGERYTGADLLSAMLVRSANDACLALAEHAAGSVEAFVEDMNRAAAVLELSATHVANPCGWDAPGQRSSASDVLRMAQAAMQYPEIGSRVAMPTFTLRSVDGRIARELRSTNLLLGELQGTVGVKTGFTAQAGKCLVALARRDGRSVWLVLLGASERWWTAHRAIEAAFADATPR
jgi:D-alanyl-D-alanine carboxypeptidase (penicillin-binding protein 5/6)